MITNFLITPHPSLQPFVDNYILSTSHGKKITLKSTWPASSETSLIFHMCDQPYHYTKEGLASLIQNRRGCVVGLLSHYNGTFFLNGVYSTFIIQFKANGFNKLFQMPVAALVNKLYHLDEVFGKSAMDLNEALQNAVDVQAMAGLADKFLLHFLKLQKNVVNLYDGITYISNELFNNAPLLSVDQYAYKANMSVRNFSRRFNEQTGVSPKFYCRLLRFNNAINLRLKHPNSNWTSIAHECGYFDQMHMIKDFKEFANTNPSSLFQPNTEFTRPRIDVTGARQESYTAFNANLSDEKFVLVKRNNL